jgi:hypothetical protein
MCEAVLAACWPMQMGIIFCLISGVLIQTNSHNCMLLLFGDRAARRSERSMTSSGTCTDWSNFLFDLRQEQMASNISDVCIVYDIQLLKSIKEPFLTAKYVMVTQK